MKLFKKFDKDGSGNVTKKEFGDLLKDLNFKMTPAELDLLFMEFDVDGSE
jgi:Ca2+-binding EF-hand superfamily protein